MCVDMYACMYWVVGQAGWDTTVAHICTYMYKLDVGNVGGDVSCMLAYV